MGDPELVLELIQDMGFDVEDSPDTEAMLSILESRWQGNEQNFGLEHFSDLVPHVLLDATDPGTMELLLKGGKASPVKSEGQAIYVLSPAEVHSISTALATVDLMKLQHDWMDRDRFRSIMPDAKDEDIDTFWMFFPGLWTFFANATNEQQCVLRSWVASE